MYYVYIFEHPTEDRIYIGFSTDLRECRITNPCIAIGSWLTVKLMLRKWMLASENDD